MIALKAGLWAFAITFIAIIGIRAAARDYARVVRKELLGEDDD